mmetsp:Transcript_197/g.1416  ORF Transcript_197/g.1416 Transcript_197/m.1416 type:complete len:82 (+) Transcript_197:918-1163(+)
MLAWKVLAAMEALQIEGNPSLPHGPRNAQEFCHDGACLASPTLFIPQEAPWNKAMICHTWCIQGRMLAVLAVRVQISPPCR